MKRAKKKKEQRGRGKDRKHRRTFNQTDLSGLYNEAVHIQLEFLW